jgi:hypothetical protein
MVKPYGYVRADGKGLFIYGDHQFTNNQNHDLIPVYTHLKDWVGLTDEEIKEIIGPYGDTPIKGYTRKLFDQIEAKLKEKNT